MRSNVVVHDRMIVVLVLASRARFECRAAELLLGRLGRLGEDGKETFPARTSVRRLEY